MNKSNVDSNLTYAELTKIENEQNWTFVRLLIALSVGVLAFSLESYESNQNSDWIIKISWDFYFFHLYLESQVYSFSKRS